MIRPPGLCLSLAITMNGVTTRERSRPRASMRYSCHSAPSLIQPASSGSDVRVAERLIASHRRLDADALAACLPARPEHQRAGARQIEARPRLGAPISRRAGDDDSSPADAFQIEVQPHRRSAVDGRGEIDAQGIANAAGNHVRPEAVVVGGAGVAIDEDGRLGGGRRHRRRERDQ